MVKIIRMECGSGDFLPPLSNGDNLNIFCVVNLNFFVFRFVKFILRKLSLCVVAITSCDS